MVDVFVKHRLVLRMLGVGLPGENSKFWKAVLTFVFTFLSILFPTLVIGFLLGSILYKEYTVTARAYSITGVISCTSAFFKLQILFKNRREIKRLMDANNGFEADTTTGKLTYALTIVYELLTIAYRTVSVVEVIVKRPKKLVSMMLKTLSNFPVDTLFLHLANQMCHRLHVLKNTMQVLGQKGDERKEFLGRKRLLNLPKGVEDDMLFKICIKEHIVVLELIKRLSKILDQFFVPLAFNSFTSLLFAFFLVSQSDDMVKEMSKITPWTTIIFAQLFIACWAGELIKKRCLDIHFAAYDNCWYESSNEMKKSLALVQTFTAKPVILRGAYIFELSLRTYETAVREVFSTFTVMYQLFNQKEG